MCEGAIAKTPGTRTRVVRLFAPPERESRGNNPDSSASASVSPSAFFNEPSASLRLHSEQAAAKKTQPTGSGGLAHMVTFSA